MTCLRPYSAGSALSGCERRPTGRYSGVILAPRPRTAIRLWCGRCRRVCSSRKTSASARFWRTASGSTGFTVNLTFDYCFVGSPFPHFPWMEAIVGCPVRFSGTAFFAESCVENWQRWRPPEAPLETPWGRKLLELMHAVAEHAGRRYPVGATLMRGPADMLAALSGPSRLPLDLFDCPEAIRRAAEACADAWIQVGQAQLALVPESTEGYMAGAQAYRTWAPEKAIWLQDDATALFSPRLYRDLLLPQITRILDQFPCTGFHLHGKIAWGIDLLLPLPKLDVIEFGPDAGQAMDELFPESKRIQEHKKLVFLRWYEEDLADWLDRVLTGFPPHGLSIQVQASNAEEGMIVKQLFDRERERCA